MKARFYQLKHKVDGLSVRERVLAFSVLLLVVFTLFDVVFFNRIRQQYLNLQSSLEKVDLQNRTKQSEIDIITRSIQEGTGNNKMNEIESLQNKILENEAVIIQYIDAVTPPEELISLLHGILHPAADFQLVKVSVDKPYKVVDVMQGEKIVEAYKQDIHLHIRGTFFSIVDYLSFLEASNWVLFWSGFEYVVDRYPVADVKLHFYTMTTGVGVYGE